MGLFSRKKNRVYSLQDTLRLLKMPQYANYTTVPVGDGFKLVPEKEVYSDSVETTEFKQRRGNFVKKLSGQGIYGSISTVPNYNNYQSARINQNQNNINLCR